MKWLVLLNHSAQNRALAELTAPNTWRYTARHGYDLLTLRLDWEASKVGLLHAIQARLPEYDAILTVGSDVLFMNHAISLDSLCQPADEVVMAYERLDYKPVNSPLNNDVVIWRRTPGTVALLDGLIDAAPQWLRHPWLWQEWLAVQYRERKYVEHVRLVEPRVMNACVQECPGKWQMGDFILHFLDMPLPGKIAFARHYLTLVMD
jgi:hypothetical protein